MAKKPTQAALKKKLWRLFAQFIKQRDGMFCVTCGEYCEGRNRQAGHYMPKGACGLEYYFGETNVHVQCAKCNCFLHGNIPNYRKFIIRKYGKKELERIERHYHKPYEKDAYIWLLEKIEHYENATTAGKK